MCGMTLFLFGAVIANGHPVVHAALLTVPFFAAVAWVCLELQSNVTVDDRTIVYYRLGRRTSILWSEIDEFHCSPRLLAVGSARLGARMKFFRAEYASLEPFDVLKAEVRKKVERRLTETWERGASPVRYRYRGLSAGTVSAYVVVTGIAFLFPVLAALAALGMGGLGIGTATFLILCLAPIVPFFARDYARTHGVLTIDQDGITKTNGKRVSIPWSEVTRLVIRDPPSVGWGSVTIEGASGRTIWVPRRLPEIGAILYLVKKHSNAVEIYGHEV